MFRYVIQGPFFFLGGTTEHWKVGMMNVMKVETRRDSGEVRSVDYGTATEVGSVRIECIAGISEVSQILGAFLVSKR